MATSIVETPFREVTMSTGITVRVYPVAETLVWRLLPSGEPRPPVPLHTMKTKTGTQERLAKEGDPEWAPYLHTLSAWEENTNQLQEDARLVLALRESEDQPAFDWPVGAIELPSYLTALIEDGELVWPKSRTRQRAYWLRAVIAPTAEDIAMLLDAVSILSGMEEGLVESVRANFRRKLRDRLLSEDPLSEDTLHPVLAADSGSIEGGPTS